MTKDEAVKLAGSKANLARLLKITKPAVSQWGNKIPELRAFQLRKIINKQVGNFTSCQKTNTPGGNNE